MIFTSFLGIVKQTFIIFMFTLLIRGLNTKLSEKLPEDPDKVTGKFTCSKFTCNKGNPNSSCMQGTCTFAIKQK